MANWASENTNLTDQGAQTTERSENDRIKLAASRGAFGDGSDAPGEVTASATGTNDVKPTENTENQRIQTAPLDPDSRLAQQDNS